MSVFPVLIGFTGGVAVVFGCAVLAYFAASHGIGVRSVARRFRSLLPLQLVPSRELKVVAWARRPEINCDRDSSDINRSGRHAAPSPSPVTPMLGEVSSTSWTILSPQYLGRTPFPPEMQFDDWLEASAACAGRQSLQGIPEGRLDEQSCPDSGRTSPYVPVTSRRSCTESFYGSVVAEPLSDAPITALSRPSDRLLERPQSSQSPVEVELDSGETETEIEIEICVHDAVGSDPRVSARSVPRTDDLNNNWPSSPLSDRSMAEWADTARRPQKLAASSCDYGAQSRVLPQFPEMMEHNPTICGSDSCQGKIRTC